MTPVGHSLFGLTLGVLCVPSGLTRRTSAAILGGFVVLANLPDAPLPGWGHDDYLVSHSAVVNAAAIVAVSTIIAIVLPRRRRPKWLTATMWIGGAAAWMSHLLLDSLYNHGKGIVVMWPISDGTLNLALPWFESLRSPAWVLTDHTLRVYGIEAVFYGPLLILAASTRVVINARLKPTANHRPD